MGLSASFKTVWSREMQEVFWPDTVWTPQANFRLENELKDGDTIKRLIPSKMVPQNYTRYNDITIQNGTTTSESLVVDKTPTIPFEISDLDELQSTPKARAKFTEMATTQLNTILNGWYTAEVTNATSVIDAADFGGTSGQGAVITAANVGKMFLLAQKKVGRLNVMKFGAGQSPFAANLTPDIYQALLEYLSGKESPLGDRTGENGHAGQWAGFDLYVHNGGYWTGKLTLSVNPSDGDTLTFKVGDQTITLTFKTTLGATAGNIHICSDAAHTVTSLVASLNAPGTTVASATDAGFVALSSDQQAALYGLTATDNTTNITFTWRGVGAPVCSNTFTSASNLFNTGLNISHCLFTKKGAIDMVVQRYPKIQIDADPDRIEEYIIKPYTLFGKKTFSNGAKKMVDVKVDTTIYT